MSELRQKVSAGTIKPITPGKYSTDLVLLMQSLLQITPSKRATIEKIVASPAIQKRMTASKASASGTSDSHVIGTIKVIATNDMFPSSPSSSLADNASTAQA